MPHERGAQEGFFFARTQEGAMQSETFAAKCVL